MNEHENRHTAEGTRDDVKPNASREEHFLRLLVTAGTEFLVRGDEVFTRQIADRDHLKVGQTMLGRHGDKPTLIPQFVKLEAVALHQRKQQSDIDIDAPEREGVRRARPIKQLQLLSGTMNQ